jgi:hypothetical protein
VYLDHLRRRRRASKPIDENRDLGEALSHVERLKKLRGRQTKRSRD